MIYLLKAHLCPQAVIEASSAIEALEIAVKKRIFLGPPDEIHITPLGVRVLNVDTEMGDTNYEPSRHNKTQPAGR